MGISTVESRAESRERVQMGVRLPKDLVKALRIRAVEQETTTGRMLERLIERYLFDTDFHSWTRNASQVSVVGLTLLETARLESVWRDRLYEGCNLQFVHLDPETSMLSSIAAGIGESEEQMREEIGASRRAFQRLAEYNEAVGQGSLRVWQHPCLPWSAARVISDNTWIRVDSWPFGEGNRVMFMLNSKDEKFDPQDRQLTAILKDSRRYL